MANAIRMRKLLRSNIPQPRWPSGTHPITLAAAQPNLLHAILSEAYETGFGTVGDFETWWATLQDDAEFDPALVTIAADPQGAPVGLIQSWTSGFIKDLAVRPAWRGRGIAEALLLSAFHACHQRGARHVDLKVLNSNFPAIRLYQRLGMTEAPL